MGSHLLEQIAQNLFTIPFHFIVFSDHVWVLFYRIIVDLLWDVFTQDEFLKKFHHLFCWEVIRKLSKFMQQIDVLIENQTWFTFEYLVNQKVDMRFLEDMRYLLKQRIKWNSRFIISFLSHFKQFLQILYF